MFLFPYWEGGVNYELYPMTRLLTKEVKSIAVQRPSQVNSV